MPFAVYFQIAIATFLWGTAFPTAKQALTLNHHCPLMIASLRFGLAGLLLLLFSLFYKDTRTVAPSHTVRDGRSRRSAQWPRVMLIGLLSTATFYGLFFLGMDLTSASSGAAVDAMSPIIGSVMAHLILHNDKLTRRKITAIIIAFCGLLIITLFKPGHGNSGISPTGCLLIVLGLIVGSAGTMLVVTYRGRLSLMRLTGCQMLFGASLLLVISLVTERHADWGVLRNPRFLALWGWLSLVSACAFRIWYGLLRRYKVTSLSVYFFFTNLWGTTLSIYFLHEKFPPQLLIGILFIISGALLMTTDRSRHERDLPPEATP